MRTKVKPASPEVALLRVLDALALELAGASDEEIQEVATQLRMDLDKPESSAFAGVTYPARPQLSDYFDLEVRKKLPPGEH
jgi:hypothetical protein